MTTEQRGGGFLVPPEFQALTFWYAVPEHDSVTLPVTIWDERKLRWYPTWNWLHEGRPPFSVIGIPDWLWRRIGRFVWPFWLYRLLRIKYQTFFFDGERPVGWDEIMTYAH